MRKKCTIFAFLFHIVYVFLVDSKCQIEFKSRKEKRGDLVERSAPLSMSFYQSTKKRGINKSGVLLTKSICVESFLPIL